MDGLDPLAAAPFELRGVENPHAAPRLPLIFASPHSGRIYPAPMMAASVLVILPVVVVFLFFQRHFINAMVLSGVKG